MSISRFPRPGHRIAPRLLRDVLHVPMTRHLLPVGNDAVLLCDLDESAWALYGKVACNRFARRVVEQVRSEFGKGVLALASRYLPPPTSNLTVEDLALELRTYNCLCELRQRRRLEASEDWRKIMIGDLLDLWSFGAKSLVDFLTSYEAYTEARLKKIEKSSDLQDARTEEIELLRAWCSNPTDPIPWNVVSLHLPTPPPGTRLSDLVLKTRTFNCLHKSAFEKDLSRLADTTVQDLVAIRGFGVNCLVDLVAALDNCKPALLKATSLESNEEIQARGLELLSRWCSEPTSPIPSHVAACRLPSPPKGMRLEDLALNIRTYNRLETAGFSAEPQGLGSCTLRDIVAIQGVGEKGAAELVRGLLQTAESTKRAIQGDLCDLSAVLPMCDTPESLPLGDGFRKAMTFGRSAGADRNCSIGMRYFGLDGNGGCTLQEVANEFGITRARTQQIIAVLVARLRKSPILARLDKAVLFVTTRAPDSADNIEKALAAEGLVAGKFCLNGLLQSARLFGRPVTFSIEDSTGGRVVVATSSVKLARRAVQVARNSLRQWGVATISDIAAQLAEKSGQGVNEGILAKLFSNQRSFSWLDQSTGWFWFRTLTKNRLARLIKKIVSVAGRIGISELRAGLGRPHRMKGFAPPRRVLYELCKQLPGVAVEDSAIVGVDLPDWKNLVRPLERTMVEILKEHGSVMQRAKFEEACKARGVKHSTFYVYLDYSPVIERLAHGVYGVRGAYVAPGVVESLIPKHQRSATVRIDQGWTSGGEVFISYRLSKSILASGVIGIPAALKRFIQGEFQIKAPDGQITGRLVIKDTSGWGLGPHFRRRGGDEGDILLLVLNLAKRQATVSIGDENMFEALSKDTSEMGLADEKTGTGPD